MSSSQETTQSINGSEAPSSFHDISSSGASDIFPTEEHTRLRSLVPLVNQPDVTFLNSGAMPPMNARVKAALEAFLDQGSNDTNPKALWKQTAADTRVKLAQFLNVPSGSITFTRDTTEGLNLFQRSLKLERGDNVVILEGEHPSQAYGWLALENQGLEVRFVPTDNTCLANADTFAPYVDDNTIAIGISSVMFHSGQMNDIQDITARYRPRGVHVLVDITQHIGAARIDLTEWNVSAAAFSLHKALACPAGLGGLYVDPAVLPTLKEAPPVVGAGSIANLPADLVARRPLVYHNTSEKFEHWGVSLIGLAALQAALSFVAEEIGIDRLERHLRALGRDLVHKIERLGLQLVGSQKPGENAPHVYVLPLLHPDWKDHFAKAGVTVSHYRAGVRLSFGFFNNTEDIDYLISVVADGLAAGIPSD